MPSTSPPRVLVIDNDERITYYLQTLLTKRGYAVYVVEGVGAALRTNAVELAQQVRPHVAIIDLRLEDDYTDERTGLTLLPALRSARCILYSAYLASDVLRQAARQYQVFDWVDKQNVQALYSVVDEAAYQTHAGRRGLTIQWPASWQWDEIIKALFKEPPSLPEVDILDDIIAQLLPTQQRVVPEAVTGAVDGLRSVVRGRSVVVKLYPHGRQPLVLKLGNARRTQREYENYEAYIHNQLPGLFHTQIEKHVVFWDLGGTLYSFVGAGQQVLPTFALHYARTSEVEAILSPLRHFFQRIWQPHYEAARPLAAPSLFAAYDEIFRLEGKLAHIAPNLIHQLRTQIAVEVTDPVIWVRTFGRDSTISSARQAVTHGDLHGDNLFVEGDRAWSIDFERTGPSHALRDFAELEVDIFARLLPYDRVDWPTLYGLVLALVGPVEAGAPVQPPAALMENDEIAKTIAVINGLRDLARTVVHYSDQREYLWAMLFDALFVASVNPMPETQRARALLYASVICERLARWGELWSLGEGQLPERGKSSTLPSVTTPVIYQKEALQVDKSQIGKIDIHKSESFFRNAGFSIQRYAQNIFGVNNPNLEWYDEKEIVVQLSHSTYSITDVEIEELIEYHRATRNSSNFAFYIYQSDLSIEAIQALYKARTHKLVIIPIHASEVQQGLLASSIITDSPEWKLAAWKREWDKLVDPYATVNSLTDPQWFFGKQQKKYVEELFRKIVSGENMVAVYGMRRIGKTAMVNQLMLRFLETQVPTVRVLCKKQQFLSTSAQFGLLDEIFQGLCVSVERLIPELRLGQVSKIKFNYPQITFENLEVALQALLKQVFLARRTASKLILILDEVDQIFPSTSVSEHEYVQYINFAQSLKGILESPDYKSLLSIIAVMEFPEINIIDRFPNDPNKQNPLYNRFLPFKLELLSDEDWKDMVQRIGALIGLEYTKEALNLLSIKTGNHPEITRKICSCLIDLHDEQEIESVIDVKEILLALDTFISDFTNYAFYLDQTFWRNPLSSDLPTDQRIIQELAKHEPLTQTELLSVLLKQCSEFLEKNRSESATKQELALEKKKIEEGLGKLVDLTILTKDESRPPLYTISIPLFKDYVRVEKLGEEVTYSW